LLPSGKVLVAGGSTDGTRANAVASAELFDPAVGTWSPVPCSCAPSSCGGDGTPQATLHVPRFQSGAATLTDSIVLITGGSNATNTALASAEVYDTATDCFRTSTGGLNTARVAHTATAYATGNAVIIGGTGLKTCEVYTPGTGINHGTFNLCSGTNTPDMQANRANHIAILLSNRYVLVAGGSGDTSADIYDTASSGTDGFTALSTTVMQVARTSATATLLSTGDVLVAGGGSNTGELFTFNPAGPSGTTTAITPTTMSSSRTGHAAIALNGGGVLLAGGHSTNKAVDVYDPISKAFGSSFSLQIARPSATIGFPVLLDGRALVAGGTTTATAAEYIIP